VLLEVAGCFGRVELDVHGRSMHRVCIAVNAAWEWWRFCAG
jgi:hypothetical protein